MKFCKQCGKEIKNEHQTFCNNCGEAIPIQNKEERKEYIEKERIPSSQQTRGTRQVKSKKKLPLILFASVFVLSALGGGGYFLVTKFLEDNNSLQTLNKKSKTSSESEEITQGIPSNTDEDNSEESSSSEKTTSFSTSEKTKEELKDTDYIIPYSSERILKESDIEGMSEEKIRLARNEIFARYGYIFKSQDLIDYFSSKSWYKPNPSYNGKLSDLETKNVNFLKSKEDGGGSGSSGTVAESKEITASEAEQLVRDFLGITDDEPIVEYDHMDGSDYVIHVYHVVEYEEGGHNATVGWYAVNPKTGKITNIMAT